MIVGERRKHVSGRQRGVDADRQSAILAPISCSKIAKGSIGVFEDAAGELEDLVLPQSGGVPPFVRSNRHPAAKGRLPDVQRLSRPT
jgi:hypothetical protein